MSTDHHEHEDHITPPSVYAIVLVVLFVLTAVTVYSVRIDFGMFNIVIAAFRLSVARSRSRFNTGWANFPSPES